MEGNMTTSTQSKPKCKTDKESLLNASKNLLFPSESDYPFTYFFFPSASRLPSASAFAKLIGKPKEPVDTTKTFSSLFDRLTMADPHDPVSVQNAKRFEALESIFRSIYTKLAVYRVGSIQVQVYIAGVNACGMSGLQTVSIET